jgi:hypothetical protein
VIKVKQNYKAKQIRRVKQNFTAEGGTRTHTPLQEADFKSAASTIPPPRRGT